jgi:hypothetical protein
MMTFGDVLNAKNPQPEKKIWFGSTPKCDLCHKTGKALKSFIDGRMKAGPWANMCPACFKECGCGKLGTGNGQKYERDENGDYVKVAG